MTHISISKFVQIIDLCFDKFNKIGLKIVHWNVLSFLQNDSIQIPFVIFLLMFGCIFFTIRLKFFNFLKFKYILKTGLSNETEHLQKYDNSKNISSVKALFTSVAGAAGVGNIAGVSVALYKGGPGAAIWMIIAAFLCMPLRFAEVFLGHKFRKKLDNGEYFGGPFFYIKECFSKLPKTGKTIAFVYGLLFVLSGFGGPNSFQMNQCVKVLSDEINFLNGQEFYISLFLSVFIGIVIFGGLKRISVVLSFILPIIIVFYFISSFIVIIYNYQNIIPAIFSIFKGAFSIGAVKGGILGTIVISLHRIICANESGLGTSSIIHASSENQDSIREAIVSMSNPVIDMFFVCFITAITVVISGIDDFSGGMSATIKAFKTVSPWFHLCIVIMMPFMVCNVIIAWSFYGLRNWNYLLNGKFKNLYLSIYLLTAFLGGIVSNFDRVLKFSDIVNLATAIPNILVLTIMSNFIVKSFEDYKKQHKL